MCMKQVHKIFELLKHLSPSDSIREIDQILTQTITFGLINGTHTWNCILRGYSNSSASIKSILIYNYFIRGSSISPDNYTYPVILKACSRLNLIEKGREVHAHVVKICFDSDIYVQNSLIRFYGCVGRLVDARQVFDEMLHRDLASWNSILGAYDGVAVMGLFREMMYEGVGVDEITLVNLFSASTEVEGKGYGKAVHAYILKAGIKSKNAVLGMYVKCRDMDSARGMFKEMVGRRDHFSYTILMSGYIEMGLVDVARDVFDQMSVKDIVSWNSMIHAYVKANQPNEAMELFQKMEVKPDGFTIVSVLSACASLFNLQYGRKVHRFLLRNKLRSDVYVGTALIDMYSKCGCLEEAMVTFYKMGYKDVFTWTTAIEGIAKNGHGNEALTVFNQMEERGVRPNEATFVSVLMACSRSGLVNEGCILFDRMMKVYKIIPKIEHFGCLVDLLSRAGNLNQAEQIIKIMPPEEKLVACKILLSACINHSEFELGTMITNELRNLGSGNHSIHTLISNYYALAGQWTKVAETRKIVRNCSIRKEPGISCVELNT